MSNLATATLKNLRVFKTYRLKYPLTQPDGNEISEINIRRIKGADQEAFEGQRFDLEKEGYKITKFWIVRLSSLVPEDVNELDVSDIQALGELIAELAEEGK